MEHRDRRRALLRSLFDLSATNWTFLADSEPVIDTSRMEDVSTGQDLHLVVLFKLATAHGALLFVQIHPFCHGEQSDGKSSNALLTEALIHNAHGFFERP